MARLLRMPQCVYRSRDVRPPRQHHRNLCRSRHGGLRGVMVSAATCPRPMTVLIVDDEEPIRRLVDRILTHAGYVTATASNGPDALRVAGTLASLDMLVTDMMMPGMDGGELARRLRGDRDGL